MRFGACANLAASSEDMTGINIIETIAGQGYDFIEMPLSNIFSRSAQEVKEIARRINDSGIKSEVCNNFFPSHIKLTGPYPTDMPAVRGYYEMALQYARDIGCKVVVFGSPGAKSFPAGFPREAAFEQLIPLIKDIDDAAHKLGLIIAIEPIRSPECNIINTFEEGCYLAEIISGKATYVLVDYFHMLWEQESVQSLLDHGHWLCHVHFACPYRPGEGERCYPQNLSEWPYGEFVTALKSIGYNERISIEAYSTEFARHSADALRLLRELLPGNH